MKNPDQLSSEESPDGRMLKKIEREGKEAVVRYAKPEDLDGILEIVQGVYNEQEKAGAKMRLVDDRLKKQWLDALNKDVPAVALVIEFGGKICGDVLVEKTIEEAFQWAPYWVLTTAVSQEYRGVGFGRVLMESAIAETKKVFDAKSLGLHVLAPNPAVELYKKLGFRQVEVFKGTGEWHGKPADGIYMEKKL